MPLIRLRAGNLRLSAPDVNFKCNTCHCTIDQDAEEVEWWGDDLGGRNNILGHVQCDREHLAQFGPLPPIKVFPPRPRAEARASSRKDVTGRLVGVGRAMGKLSEAIGEAVADPRSIQHRVYSVVNAIALLLPQDLEGDLRETYEGIMATATALDHRTLDIARAGTGRIETTCLSLTDDEAVALMGRLVTFLYEELKPADAALEADLAEIDGRS